MATSPVKTRRWTRVEYDTLIDAGFFHPGEKLELLAGDLVVREPQGGPHMTAIGLAEDALRTAFGSGWIVRTQGPIALDDETEPEPDVAVVRGSRRDYVAGHPGRPALLVEVAESTLAFDREQKGSLYARANVPEYWIINLVDRVLEVYREPGADPAAPYGWCYRALLRLGPADWVSPLAAPGARIPVADLLP
jgi:Uma2 family endonuclease